MHWPEDSDEQDARRVRGAAGRTSGYEIAEDGEVCRAEHESVNQNCGTRIEEVDEVEHEEVTGRESRRERKSLEKGRLCEHTILDNPANRKELNTR